MDGAQRRGYGDNADDTATTTTTNLCIVSGLRWDKLATAI